VIRTPSAPRARERRSSRGCRNASRLSLGRARRARVLVRLRPAWGRARAPSHAVHDDTRRAFPQDGARRTHAREVAASAGCDDGGAGERLQGFRRGAPRVSNNMLVRGTALDDGRILASPRTGPLPLEAWISEAAAGLGIEVFAAQTSATLPQFTYRGHRRPGIALGNRGPARPRRRCNLVSARGSRGPSSLKRQGRRAGTAVVALGDARSPA
jgi:hypothetical protein